MVRAPLREVLSRAEFEVRLAAMSSGTRALLLSSCPEEEPCAAEFASPLARLTQILPAPPGPP